MEIRLIVNPAASAVSGRRCRDAERELAAHHRVRVETTSGRGVARELAAREVEDGVDAVVTLGGDGTLNEVANALVGTDVVLGALPGGSTNVFCRSLGMDHDVGLAARQLAGALAAQPAARIGVGGARADSAPTRWFLSHAGIGWDAALVELVERRPHLKGTLGHAAFVAAGLRTFLGGYDRSRPHVRVVTARHVVPDGFFALAMNRDPYTYLGRRPFVVDPDNTDERALTIAVVRSMRVRHFAPLLPAALRGGGLRSGEHLEVLRDVGSALVERLGPMDLQLDGDHLGPVDRVELSHRPAALLVAAPMRHDPT